MGWSRVGAHHHFVKPMMGCLKQEQKKKRGKRVETLVSMPFVFMSPQKIRQKPKKVIHLVSGGITGR